MINNDTGAEWWRSAVVYQIYPRSFADADGDGIGDLPGITSRVGYLADLGVDAVWLSPFYPSPLADGGYDVADHRDVDARLGTLADFDALVAALHGRGVKMIIDVVPNHTSEDHPWFRAALAAAPASPERDRYLFRDGLGPDGEQPPNDWQSGFGGPAWHSAGDGQVEARERSDHQPHRRGGQWYFHFFAKEQPDLNWDNPEVRTDFRTTLRFWADRGVDGFRVDVAHGLVKDMSEPYRPWAEISEMMVFADGSHPLWDRDEVHQVYADWRRLFAEYDPPRFAVAEACVHPSRRARYASAESLGQAFNFEMQDADWRPTDFRRVIDSGLADMRESGSATTWLLGCHDSPRVATRYGLPLNDARPAQQVARDWLLTDGREPLLDAALGERRARAAAMILLALPGSIYIYQGDELGLQEVPDLPPEVLQDPMATRSAAEKGRDGCRVPLPWEPTGPSFGFGARTAQPPQPAWFAGYAVSRQAGGPDSTMNLYRRAIALRRILQTDEEFSWIESADADVLHFRRGDWHCVANFGSRLVALPAGDLLISSSPLTGDQLPSDTSAWIRPN